MVIADTIESNSALVVSEATLILIMMKVVEVQVAPVVVGNRLFFDCPFFS